MSKSGFRTNRQARLPEAGNLHGGFLMAIDGCSLGMRGCRKNCAVVSLENLQPGAEIGSVLFPRFLVQFEVSAQKHGPLTLTSLSSLPAPKARIKEPKNKGGLALNRFSARRLRGHNSTRLNDELDCARGA